MTSLQTLLESKNYNVFLVPESPTIVISGNASYPGLEGGELLFAFEQGIINIQTELEDSFIRIAEETSRRNGKKSVVICDRGIFDIPAYLPEDGKVWADVVSRAGLTESAIASRYDGVVHLKTAADGAEKFYTTANNAARTETPEQARALDSAVHKSWETRCGSSKVHVAGNNVSFDDKIKGVGGVVLGWVDKF
jgi:hypothetical protein